MATKYSMNVVDAETEEHTPIALYSDLLTPDALQDICDTLWADVEGASEIYVVDMDTGEIVASVSESDYPDCACDYYNEDMGFDPYLGCYTDDC